MINDVINPTLVDRVIPVIGWCQPVAEKWNVVVAVARTIWLMEIISTGTVTFMGRPVVTRPTPKDRVQMVEFSWLPTTLQVLVDAKKVFKFCHSYLPINMDKLCFIL